MMIGTYTTLIHSVIIIHGICRNSAPPSLYTVVYPFQRYFLIKMIKFSTSSDCVMKNGAGTSERNCSTIDHNWSTIDSRCFEREIRYGGLSSKNHLPCNWKRGRVQLRKITAQLEHNWFPLFRIRNSEWGGSWVPRTTAPLIEKRGRYNCK